MLKWMQTDQEIYEKKLKSVMKRLKIEDFNFNWNRNSCYIEFQYQENSYRMEHSVQIAREKGLILRNGLYCLKELVQSLEDLCRIIERGTYKLETWISGFSRSDT